MTPHEAMRPPLLVERQPRPPLARARGLTALLAPLVLWAGACGGPVLQNAPRPDPAVVAGAAAATAAAITLADPDAAARRAAANEDARRKREQARGVPTSNESAPADVLDRLDAAERQAKDPDAPAPQPAATTPDARPLPQGATFTLPGGPPPPR
ncbi:MAG: hypothetical protein R3B48_09470 [Kofleriaceae bacterium]